MCAYPPWAAHRQPYARAPTHLYVPTHEQTHTHTHTREKGHTYCESEFSPTGTSSSLSPKLSALSVPREVRRRVCAPGNEPPPIAPLSPTAPPPSCLGRSKSRACAHRSISASSSDIDPRMLTTTARSLWSVCVRERDKGGRREMSLLRCRTT